MTYNFDIVGNALIISLNTELGVYEPQIFTLKFPSLELGLTLHVKDVGIELKNFPIHEIGLIDGVAPTDLLDANDLLTALIAPLVPTFNLGIQSVSGTNVDDTDPDNPIILSDTLKADVAYVDNRSGVVSSTTVALSLVTLNSSYPDAEIGFRVFCESIIAGKLVYSKTDTGWVSQSITTVI